MKITAIKLLISLLVTIPVVVQSQTTYFIPGGKEEILLNRLEIKTRTNYFTFSAIKPYNRRDVISEVEHLDSLYSSKNNAAKQGLSNIDYHNIQSMLMANSEWSKMKNTFSSKQPILRNFYLSKANMVDLKKEGFRLIVNPIIQYQQGSSGGNTQSTFNNQRGVLMRGDINSKIGFYFYFTENQERQPDYVRSYIYNNIAVPGAGYNKGFKTNASDFFDVRGGLTWKVASFMDMSLGYDRNFIGNGYRSLLLSDFSTNAMFLKVNTHFGKFNYQNLFMELVAQRIAGPDRIYPRKYSRISYLSYNATKWLNIGLFDGIILGKTDAMSLPLFNPIMFVHIPSKSEKGIDDKNYTGFDIKFNLANKIQVYHQMMIDRLKINELKNNWWGNKFGYQLGFKYIDVLGIKNLDIQAETNAVRPFTYSSTDSFTSYNHYNQQLAHPLGANFKEYVAILKYQPLPKLFLEAKVIYYKQGLDSVKQGALQNFGSSIFSFNQTRNTDYGWEIGTGDLAKCTIITLLASYEIKENLFFDVSFLSRNFDRMTTGKLQTKVVTAGIRWNIGRREFLF